MPVYKEGLESVLQPTINSLQKAIQTYELQGGSVNILVCDDGMQLLNEEDFATRKVSGMLSKDRMVPINSQPRRRSMTRIQSRTSRVQSTRSIINERVASRKRPIST